MISKQPHIIVVGAGIIGSSLAYHLTRQKARVTLIDKGTEPANEATEKSFGWISAGQNLPDTYLHLRQQAIEDWHRVENELNGKLKIDWSGALSWQKDVAETQHIAYKLIDAGYKVSLIDEQEIRLLEPNLKTVPARAMFAKQEGAIDPGLTTELLIKAAHESGADIQLGNEVLSFITNSSGVAGVVTKHGNITADTVVLATGIYIATLCRPLNLKLPILVLPAILMSFRNHHQFVNCIVSNPLMEIRAASQTLTIAAENYIDESEENNPHAIAQRTLEKIKKHWHGAAQIKLANVTVGKRPIPQDGLPIIGRATNIGGLYLSVMHAGVTLAAMAGRLAADEILTNQDHILLSLYRPERFT